MLTCKDFLNELNDFLDESLDPGLRAQLQRHLNECPNCWVVCDTTEKTLKICKGMEAKPVPKDIHDRLMAALSKRIEARGPICGSVQGKTSPALESSSEQKPKD